MALRATNGPAPATRSATLGQAVEFTAKVENTGSAEESVLLAVEEEKGGFLFVFEPASLAVPPKTRRQLVFTWTAALPEGKDALTFRGKLVLRRATDGALAGSAPLDIYVRRTA